MRELRGTNWGVNSHIIEVEEMIPGRNMDVSMHHGYFLANLSRTGSEKLVGIASSVLFFVLTMAIALHLFAGRHRH